MHRHSWDSKMIEHPTLKCKKCNRGYLVYQCIDCKEFSQLHWTSIFPHNENCQ
jgi:hypothetical protein